MEFWGIEVKPGKPVTVTPKEGTLIHVSQASLGECKNKKGEFVPLHVKVGNQNLVLGTLSTENIPQLFCDLVFEKEFELSHTWGKGSVYFVGYKTPNIKYPLNSEEEEEEVEEVPAGNAAKAVAKPKAKPAEVKPVADAEEDDSDSDEMDEDDSDGDDDSEEEEETPTPKKPASNKKRANETAPKTPVSSKKAKVAVTPQKTGKDINTPKPATQSPKSASQVSCGSCKKTFNSGNALEAHNKAKHSAA
ncbi:hypothetical protein ARALYDRAFT_484880, partial [Arabidopsis lyrata subsp. lyrata]